MHFKLTRTTFAEEAEDVNKNGVIKIINLRFVNLLKFKVRIVYCFQLLYHCLIKANYHNDKTNKEIRRNKDKL